MSDLPGGHLSLAGQDVFHAVNEKNVEDRQPRKDLQKLSLLQRPRSKSKKKKEPPWSKKPQGKSRVVIMNETKKQTTSSSESDQETPQHPQQSTCAALAAESPVQDRHSKSRTGAPTAADMVRRWSAGDGLQVLQEESSISVKRARVEPATEEAWLVECTRACARAKELRAKPCWRAVHGVCEREFCGFSHPTAEEALLLRDAAALHVAFPDLRKSSWRQELEQAIAKVRLLQDSFCVAALREGCSRPKCRCSHGAHLSKEDLELLRSAVAYHIQLPLVSGFVASALVEKVRWRIKAATRPCPIVLAGGTCPGKCPFNHSFDLAKVEVCVDFVWRTCTRTRCHFQHPVGDVSNLAPRRLCVPHLFSKCEHVKCFGVHVVEQHCPDLRVLARAGAVFPKLTRATKLAEYTSACASGTFRFRPFACGKHLLSGCSNDCCLFVHLVGKLAAAAKEVAVSGAAIPRLPPSLVPAPRLLPRPFQLRSLHAADTVLAVQSQAVVHQDGGKTFQPSLSLGRLALPLPVPFLLSTVTPTLGAVVLSGGRGGDDLTVDGCVEKVPGPCSRGVSSVVRYPCCGVGVRFRVKVRVSGLAVVVVRLDSCLFASEGRGGDAALHTCGDVEVHPGPSRVLCPSCTCPLREIGGRCICPTCDSAELEALLRNAARLESRNSRPCAPQHHVPSEDVESGQAPHQDERTDPSHSSSRPEPQAEEEHHFPAGAASFSWAFVPLLCSALGKGPVTGTACCLLGPVLWARAVGLVAGCGVVYPTVKLAGRWYVPASDQQRVSDSLLTDETWQEGVAGSAGRKGWQEGVAGRAGNFSSTRWRRNGSAHVAARTSDTRRGHHWASGRCHPPHSSWYQHTLCLHPLRRCPVLRAQGSVRLCKGARPCIGDAWQAVAGVSPQYNGRSYSNGLFFWRG